MARPLVVVTWHDAWADTDGFASMHGIQQTHQPMPIQTIGWLLQDDDVGVSLANEQSQDRDDGQEVFRGRTFIPRAMVQTVQPFKMTKPRKAKVEVPSVESVLRL